MLCAELRVFLLLICGDDASGGVDDCTESVFIETVLKVFSRSALRTVSRYQEVRIRHQFS